MKITDISTQVVNACMRNWIFVKVQTDVPGLHGWGEATLEWKTRAVVGCVEDLKPMIIGRDPRDIDFLWQILYRHSYFRLGVIGMSAISGIEQACWDIFGKSQGLPVYRLLGGKVRDKVRMYTHLGGGETKSVYESFESAKVIERAMSVREQGYTALKVVFVPYLRPLEGTRAVKQFAKLFGDLRAAVGDDIDIMVDFHGRTTTGPGHSVHPRHRGVPAAVLRRALSRPRTWMPCSRDMLGDVPWRFDVVETDMQREAGYWLPLERPGLGIEINEREAAKHPFEQEILQQMTFHEDGSVAEW